MIEVGTDVNVACTSAVKSDAATGGVQYHDEASCTGIPASETVILSSATKSTETIDVAYNTNKKYYLIVEYANNGDQAGQQGQTFSVKVNAEQVANS